MGVFDKIYDLLEVCDYTRLYVVIYAYICSMVKGRMRTLNHATFIPIHTRAYTAYGHGAVDRTRSISNRYRLRKALKGPILNYINLKLLTYKVYILKVQFNIHFLT